MKIALINTFDIYGGAARAAYRLFRGLRGANADAKMYTLHKMSADPDVVTVGAMTAEQAVRAKAVEAEIFAENQAYPVLRGQGFVPFHSERSPFGEALTTQLPHDAVVNLHWVRGLVDYEAMFSVTASTKSVVWTLHDMHPFTGGCHYTAGCQRFADTCGCCPFLGSDDADDISARIVRRKIKALNSRRCPLHVVAPSRWLAKEAQRSAVFQNLPVSVIPYGLETDLFKPQDRQRIRQELGLPQEDILILFIAHVLNDPRKGLEFLDKALTLLGPRNDVATLLVGGGDIKMNAPFRHFRAGVISDDVSISRLYAAADLAVVASLEDNLPNTMMEALACGIPVVGFDVGGVPDMVRPGETGFLADPADAESMAKALSIALSDRMRLVEMGRKSRQCIEQDHTLAIQAERYLDLYRSIAV
jgi:glycosyltransferase involved in cell wall biosynthesis